MPKFLFTIYLTGYGEDVDKAWIDAASAADLMNDPTPDSDQYLEILKSGEEEDE